MSTLTLTPTNGASGSSKSQSWLQSSVQTFFLGINWDDQPPEVQQIKLTSIEAAAKGQPTELSLKLSVNQFFAAIDWDGAAVAPTIIDHLFESEPPIKADELTLDAFSGLF